MFTSLLECPAFMPPPGAQVFNFSFWPYIYVFSRLFLSNLAFSALFYALKACLPKGDKHRGILQLRGFARRRRIYQPRGITAQNVAFLIMSVCLEMGNGLAPSSAVLPHAAASVWLYSKNTAHVPVSA